MIKLLLLTLFISSAFAQDKECDHLDYPELHELLAVAGKLDWFSADKDDIQNAPCTRKKPFSNDEMTSWLRSNQSSFPINENIHGISFEDESAENLNSFRLLTSAANIFGFEPSRQKKLSSNCKKVDCAVKELFGADEGLRILFMHRRFGLNASHMVRENTAPFKKSELDTIMLSLSDFPVGILPMSENRMIMRAPPGTGTPGLYANATITVFDEWANQDPVLARGTITHEMGHVMAGTTHVDGDEKWLSKSGWDKKTKIINGESVSSFESKKQNFISEYAAANPAEDFAETVTAYRYNPKSLKEVSPEKYELIKEIIFDGVEYTSEEACQKTKRRSEGLKSKVVEKLKTWTPTEQELRQISNRCNRLAVLKIMEQGVFNNSTSRFEQCYEEAVKAQTASMMKELLKGDPLEELLGPMVRNAQVPLSPEKMKAITAKVKDFHRKEMKNHFQKALSYKYFCDEDFIDHTYQRFDENTMELDTYELKHEFKAIAGRACKHLANKSAAVVANEMMP